MNKLFFTLCCVVCGSIALASCRPNVLHGTGKKGTITPQTGSFTAVDIELPVKASITVREGASPSVTISGYDNVLQHIKAKVKGDALEVSTDLDDTWRVDCDDMNVEITMPAMTALTLSGAPDANVHGNIAGNEFKLAISGASKVVIDNINVTTFTSEVSGAADIEVRGGAVRKSSYEISGAGKIKAFPLQSAATSASISGAGKGEVTALEKLDASISGAGTIKYKGHPAVTQNVSGVGSISEAN